MANIKKIAADIKRELLGKDNCDLEFLAQLFEDPSISDTGSGNELQNRLLTILMNSSDGSNNGVTHFHGIYAGCRDRGFRDAFKDPWPGRSDNQVGHFTTAVDMGFRPRQTYLIVPQTIRDAIAVPPSVATSFEETLCMFLIVGHEQVGDDAVLASVRQAMAPLPEEIVQFFLALSNVGKSPNQDVNGSRTRLSGIRIGTGVGNSIQDLHLSLFGFKFGQMIRQGQITSRGWAALWIRTNLGGVIADETPLPPNTAIA